MWDYHGTLNCLKKEFPFTSLSVFLKSVASLLQISVPQIHCASTSVYVLTSRFVFWNPHISTHSVIDLSLLKIYFFPNWESSPYIIYNLLISCLGVLISFTFFQTYLYRPAHPAYPIIRSSKAVPGFIL